MRELIYFSTRQVDEHWMIRAGGRLRRRAGLRRLISLKLLNLVDGLVEDVDCPLDHETSTKVERIGTPIMGAPAASPGRPRCPGECSVRCGQFAFDRDEHRWRGPDRPEGHVPETVEEEGLAFGHDDRFAARAGNLDPAFGNDDERAGPVGAAGGERHVGVDAGGSPGEPGGHGAVDEVRERWLTARCRWRRRHGRVEARPKAGNSSGCANTVISEIAASDRPRTTKPKSLIGTFTPGSQVGGRRWLPVGAFGTPPVTRPVATPPATNSATTGPAPQPDRPRGHGEARLFDEQVGELLGIGAFVGGDVAPGQLVLLCGRRLRGPVVAVVRRVALQGGAQLVAAHYRQPQPSSRASRRSRARSTPRPRGGAGPRGWRGVRSWMAARKASETVSWAIARLSERLRRGVRRGTAASRRHRGIRGVARARTLQLIRERSAPTSPEVVEAGVGRDRVQPRTKRRATRERAPTVPRSQERLLYQVFGSVEGAQHPVAVNVELPPVRLGDLAERGPHHRRWQR